MLIVICSKSGGVAKSTTALHLAHELAQRGKTQVWDLDQNDTCSKWLERCEAAPSFEVNEPGSLDGFAHTIIDTAAAPGEEALAELAKSADLLIIPATCSQFDVDPAIATWLSLVDYGTPIQFLLTLAPSAPSKSASKSHTGFLEAGLPTISQWVTHRHCYLEAANGGLVVQQIKSASARKAATEWSAIAQEILNHGG
jgi:chromosome partitioning protein